MKNNRFSGALSP